MMASDYQRPSVDEFNEQPGKILYPEDLKKHQAFEKFEQEHKDSYQVLPDDNEPKVNVPEEYEPKLIRSAGEVDFRSDLGSPLKRSFWKKLVKEHQQEHFENIGKRKEYMGLSTGGSGDDEGDAEADEGDIEANTAEPEMKEESKQEDQAFQEANKENGSADEE